MNSTWNKNKSAFQKRFPALYELLKSGIIFIDEEFSKGKSVEQISAPFFTLATAKNGDYTATENKMRLHSAYNPSSEARTAVIQTEVSSKSAAVFYGFGLGWHVIEFSKNFPDKKLILIEPDFLRFLVTLTILDWTEVFNHKQLIIATGLPDSQTNLSVPPDIQQILTLIEDTSKINTDNSGVSDAYFFDIPSFYAHAKNYFENLKALIHRNIQKNQINATTLRRFGKLWVRNSLKNLDHLIKNDGINSLKMACADDMPCDPASATFSNNVPCTTTSAVSSNTMPCAPRTDIPFVIVGAGPSLQGLVPYLQEISRRAVIICVETALHFLLKHNVQCDFIVLLDSQYWAYRHIAGLSAPNSYLVTDISAYPAVFRFKCREILLCDSAFPVGKFFQKNLNLDKGDLGTGGSVATSAWNLARFLGARNIYFAGVDLSFPQKQTHVKGSSAEQTFHKLSSKIKPAEQFSVSSLFSAPSVHSTDYQGNSVFSDSRMQMFAWWFESNIASNPQVKNYTLCPQSLKINGITPVSIQDFLKLPEIKKSEILQKNKITPISDETLKNFQKLKSEFPDQTDFFAQNESLKQYFAK